MDRCESYGFIASDPTLILDRSLSNEEVNALQAQVEKRVVQEMGLEIR